jgi:hypothetical protein
MYLFLFQKFYCSIKYNSFTLLETNSHRTCMHVRPNFKYLLYIDAYVS